MNKTHIDPASQLAAATIEVKPDLLALTERQRRNFERKIDKSGGPDACWIWIGSCCSDGYGNFFHNGKCKGAHRISFQIENGVISNDINVLHNCPSGDNPSCVNPRHLWLGSQADNVHDMVKKKRYTPALGDNNGSRKYPERLCRGDDNGSRKYPEKLKRGIENQNAKLNDDKVREIRSSALPWRVLMAKYGVGENTIMRVKNRTAWAHVM